MADEEQAAMTDEPMDDRWNKDSMRGILKAVPPERIEAFRRWWTATLPDVILRAYAENTGTVGLAVAAWEARDAAWRARIAESIAYWKGEQAAAWKASPRRTEHYYHLADVIGALEALLDGPA